MATSEVESGAADTRKWYSWNTHSPWRENMPKQWDSAALFEFLVTQAGLPQEDLPSTLDVTFEDIGLDSLAYLQLQSEVFGSTGVELPADPPPGYTLADILDAVNLALTAQ
jgi:minimal PKS acyl carrier protein